MALPRIAIIADDLTGALDAAAPFADRGRHTVVATGPAFVAAALATDPDVIAVSTESREAEEAAAVAAVLEAARALSAVPVLFKKVDSRLKGHVRAETAALARAAGRRSVLLCPAIPEIGRHVVGGRLAGFGVSLAFDGAGLVAGSDPPIELADAATDADLDALVAAAGDRMLAGARGLAAALARRSFEAAASPALLRLGVPMAIAVGSRDPVTLAQVARLREGRPELPVRAAPDGHAAGPAPAGPVVALQATPGPGADPSAVQAALARSFVPAFAEGRRTLVLTGGATASAILDRLGLGVLELLGEMAPGLPVSRAVGHRAPLDVVTKSGGFGTPDALLALVEGCLASVGDRP